MLRDETVFEWFARFLGIPKKMFSSRSCRKVLYSGLIFVFFPIKNNMPLFEGFLFCNYQILIKHFIFVNHFIRGLQCH